jgi:glycine/D-amino acid oxidase-like deaminating enzyme
MAMLMPFKPIGAPMHYDVVVVGGGTAGVAAAVGAAQCGAHTLLIERYGFLGGAATHSNVLAYCGLFAQGGDVPRSVVGGVGAAVLGHMRDMGIDSSARRSYSGNWIVPLNCEPSKSRSTWLCWKLALRSACIHD